MIAYHVSPNIPYAMKGAWYPTTSARIPDNGRPTTTPAYEPLKANVANLERSIGGAQNLQIPWQAGYVTPYMYQQPQKERNQNQICLRRLWISFRFITTQQNIFNTLLLNNFDQLLFCVVTKNPPFSTHNPFYSNKMMTMMKSYLE